MKIPSHIAIIMDGNGRWAKKRGLPRRKGHQAGVNALKKVTRKAGELGILSLTVYAFSTENWKRPTPEVSFLLQLFQRTLIKQTVELFENNVRVQIIGHRSGLGMELLDTVKEIEEKTSSNTGLKLNIAFNYGGRAEILDMVKKIINGVGSGKIDPERLSEEDLTRYLYLPDIPEIELLIRTSGEERLSNFLLWQSAYAELYFCDKYWPDFDGDDLVEAIKVYQDRNRRFGGLGQGGEE